MTLPGRALVAAAVTLLAVLLPALVAGLDVERPADPVEQQRIEAAIADPRGELGGLSNLFYAALGEGATPQDPTAARLASLLGMLALSGLLYLSVAQARGRGQAVLACLALAGLAPVYHQGCAIRPELPATLFGLLALTILVGLPNRIRALRPPASRRLAWTVVVLLAAVVGSCEGLSVLALPALGVHLLVPGGCLLIALLLEGSAFLQALRRFRMLVLPMRAFTLRLLPWFMAAFAGLLAATAMLSRIEDPAEPSLSAIGLWPAPIQAWLPLALLALGGGLTWMLRVGLRLGRLRRIEPETVLTVYVLALSVYWLKSDAARDALPAAPALAVLIAEGARLALLFGGAALSRVVNR